MSEESAEQRKERQARLSKAMGAMFLQDKVDKLERSSGDLYGSNRTMRKSHSGSFASASSSRSVMRTMPRAATGPGILPATPRSHARSRVSVRVVDASVLIFALRTVHNWDKDASSCVIVPLEAINTLDLLKKGEEPINLAARKATRWLEERMQAAPSDDVLLHPRPGIYAQQPTQTTSSTQLEQRRLQCFSPSEDSTDSFAPRQAALHLRELMGICLYCQETVASDCDFAVAVAYAPIHLQSQLLEPGLPASLTYAPRIDGRTTEAWLDAYHLPSEIAQTSKSWTGERSSPLETASKQASDFGSLSVLKAHQRSPQIGSLGTEPDDRPMVITSKPKPDTTNSPARAKTAAEKMEDFLKRLEA